MYTGTQPRSYYHYYKFTIMFVYFIHYLKNGSTQRSTRCCYLSPIKIARTTMINRIANDVNVSQDLKKKKKISRPVYRGTCYNI